MWLLAFVIPRNFLYAGFFEHKINNNYIYKELDNDTKKTTILRVENTGDYKNDLGNLACLMINLTSPNNINQENKLEIKDMDCNPYLTNDSYSKVQLRNLIIDMLDKKQTSKEIELKLLGEDKTIKWELVIN